MQIDHVCVAVRSIEKSAQKLCGLLGFSVKTGKVTNTRQQVNVQFLQRPGSIDIKLIEPAAEASPLWQFLKRDEGPHHLFFRVDGAQAQLFDLEKLGLRLLAQSEAGEAFDDGLIALGYRARALTSD